MAWWVEGEEEELTRSLICLLTLPEGLNFSAVYILSEHTLMSVFLPSNQFLCYNQEVEEEMMEVEEGCVMFHDVFVHFRSLWRCLGLSSLITYIASWNHLFIVFQIQIKLTCWW